MDVTAPVADRIAEVKVKKSATRCPQPRPPLLRRLPPRCVENAVIMAVAVPTANDFPYAIAHSGTSSRQI